MPHCAELPKPSEFKTGTLTSRSRLQSETISRAGEATADHHL